jgi:hypothetical protein
MNVYFKQDGKLRHYIVDTSDHIEAINAVKGDCMVRFPSQKFTILCVIPK